jgi:hypothetical protein
MDDDIRYALKDIALAQVAERLWEQAAQTAERFLASSPDIVLEVLEALVEAGDRRGFKRLLVLCAGDVETAKTASLLLFRAYPSQAPAIAEVVSPQFETPAPA